jgi:hypothetical protein
LTVQSESCRLGINYVALDAWNNLGSVQSSIDSHSTEMYNAVKLSIPTISRKETSLARYLLDKQVKALIVSILHPCLLDAVKVHGQVALLC